MLPWQLHGNPQEVFIKVSEPQKMHSEPQKMDFQHQLFTKKLKFDTKKGVFQHQIFLFRAPASRCTKNGQTQVCTSRAPPPPSTKTWPNVLSQPGAWQYIYSLYSFMQHQMIDDHILFNGLQLQTFSILFLCHNFKQILLRSQLATCQGLLQTWPGWRPTQYDSIDQNGERFCFFGIAPSFKSFYFLRLWSCDLHMTCIWLAYDAFLPRQPGTHGMTEGMCDLSSVTVSFDRFDCHQFPGEPVQIQGPRSFCPAWETWHKKKNHVRTCKTI